MAVAVSGGRVRRPYKRPNKKATRRPYQKAIPECHTRRPYQKATPPGQTPPGQTPPAQVHAEIHTGCQNTCWDTPPPPLTSWTEWMTHACENITPPPLIPKLAIVVLGVRYEPLNSNLPYKFEHAVAFLLFSYKRLCTVAFGICPHISYAVRGKKYKMYSSPLNLRISQKHIKNAHVKMDTM